MLIYCKNLVKYKRSKNTLQSTSNQAKLFKMSDLFCFTLNNISFVIIEVLTELPAAVSLYQPTYILHIYIIHNTYSRAKLITYGNERFSWKIYFCRFPFIGKYRYILGFDMFDLENKKDVSKVCFKNFYLLWGLHLLIMRLIESQSILFCHLSHPVKVIVIPYTVLNENSSSLVFLCIINPFPVIFISSILLLFFSGNIKNRSKRKPMKAFPIL